MITEVVNPRSIAIFDLRKCCSSNCNERVYCYAICYARNTTCIVPAATLSNLSADMSCVISKVFVYWDGNNLIINGGKKKLVSFSKNNKSNNGFYIQIDRKPIPETLHMHCADLHKKLCTVLFGINILNHSVTIFCLEAFYLVYVESRLRYEFVFWGSSSNLHEIFKLVLCSVSTTIWRTGYFDVYLPLHLYMLAMYATDNNTRLRRKSEIYVRHHANKTEHIVCLR